MQQRRHFAGFLPFFWRGTSHHTAILYCCAAHLYASKGFQPSVALQCPWLLGKTLSSFKKLQLCGIAGKKISRNFVSAISL
jgi:hypothetical protein